MPQNALARYLRSTALAILLVLPQASSAQKSSAGSERARATAASQRAATRHPARRPASDRASSRTTNASSLHWREATGITELSTDLESMLQSRVRNGTWGVLVVSLTRGDTLFSLNPDALLQPASNMKLFTAALALDQFSPSHMFSTDVLTRGSLDADGTLHGDLIIRGGGDPGLSDRFIEGGPAAAMEDLATQVRASGVRRVTDRLMADASAFDAQRIPDGWQSRYLYASYAARVSALSLNENLATLVIQPGAASQAPEITIEPATTIRVVNKVKTVAGRGARVVVLPQSEGQVEVRGWIGTRAGERRYQIVVDKPARFTAGALRRALESQGITVEGPTVLAGTPEDAKLIASIHSAPLRQLLATMNRESINHYAELLFRDAGGHWSPTGVGTVETSNELLQQFMTGKVGAIPGSVYAADGSGLSVLDRTTPRALVELLAYAHRAPWGETFHASLPVAGESELLRNRMKRTPAQGNLHAKTGTTNSIISLAGYVTAESGELLAFAFLYNGKDRWNARATIDAMGPTLASFIRE